MLIVSTGLKVYGAGEWLVEKHGQKSRRGWRKLFVAVNADSGQIVGSVLTEQDVDDPSQVGSLLEQIPQEIGRRCFAVASARLARGPQARHATGRYPV